jgi:hypothetical protein
LRLALGTGLECRRSFCVVDRLFYLLLGGINGGGLTRLGGKSAVDKLCRVFAANMACASLEAICEASEIA